MGENWVTNLDMLAAGGVIDFDAPAYLLDKPSRYVGNPRIADLPVTNISLLPEGTKLKDVPSIDEFNGMGIPNKEPAQPAKWKKWLFGMLAAAGVIGLASFGFSKYGKTISKKFKPSGAGKFKWKMPDMSKLKTGAKNLGSKVWSGIKKPFIWIAGKFRKKP